MKRALSSVAVAILVLFSSTQAQAWDGVVNGTITRIDVSSGGDDYGFRVYLSPGQAMCTGSTADWAFINKSTSNYEASVAMLNSAFLAGKPVTLYTTLSQGYCEIGYISTFR